jgi:hypothetical protein
MLALSVRQPHASAIMTGAKPIEYRAWAPPAALIGRRIAIHASRSVDADLLRQLSHQTDLPRGAVIGTVKLVAVWPDRAHGWAWLLAEPVVFAAPIAARGQQKLWEWAS